MRRLWFPCAWLAIALGCEGADTPPSPTSPASPPFRVSTEATQGAGRMAPLSEALARPGAEIVVAIGDLHGDLSAARKALRVAKAIDDADRWIGGRRVVVQTGDEIDRGDEDREVLDLMSRLRTQARAAGGDLIALSGNHELMNVALDFRYVTPAGFAEFGGPEGRATAFRPGGPYARMLADRPIFVKVGDSLFVHGGILPKHVSYGLDRMQREVRAWLLGESVSPPESVMSDDGPVWTRLYSVSSESTGCEELTQVLSALKAKRMVVGHTPQARGISSSCGGRLFRIDVGMSKHYGGPVQVLEIRGDALRTLAASPEHTGASSRGTDLRAPH